MSQSKNKKFKILFLCVANSSRSQMAEGLAQNSLGTSYEIKSAGSSPTKVNPFAVKVMNEIGIDISDYKSKAVEELPDQFVKNLDLIITLCAEEVCPVFLSQAKRLHWGEPDPAAVFGSDEIKLKEFRKVRDSIRKRIGEYFLE